VTLASHPPGESPKSANARDLLQNMSLNRVEDFFIADVGIGIDGLILEFGVFAGRTINHIAGLLPGKKVYGFDSFQGLPETWRPGFAKGAFARSELPSVRENVELVVGWFDRTLPTFCDLHPNQKAALLHVDCDLYSSAQTILHNMVSYIAPGTIIVFDEYFNYPGWSDHEYRAFKEFVRANRMQYKYIGLVPHWQQVAVRILG
jgi:predicted O-methyltransferase YrrM